MTAPFPRLFPLGDACLLVQLGDEIDLALNARVHALAHWIEGSGLPGLVETVPGYATLAVHFDPLLVDVERLQEWLRAGLESLPPAEASSAPQDAPLYEFATRYGGEFGPDLGEVARMKGLAEGEVVRLHSSIEYRVLMLGFTPGFPYLGIVPVEIAAPRLGSPRPRVPAGSVAIAGRQTGIYPRATPGGWRLIGMTEVKLFDSLWQHPTLLKPGDRVRFRPV